MLVADGGTRTAAITGGWVALALAAKQMVDFSMINAMPLNDHVAATSVGIIDDTPLLDLCYEEDSRAGVDMNVVMNSAGAYVEVQATAEGQLFSGDQLQDLLALAGKGVEQLMELQKEIITL